MPKIWMYFQNITLMKEVDYRRVLYPMAYLSVTVTTSFKL